MRLLGWNICVVAFVCCVCCVSLVAQSSGSLESRRKALNDLLAEHWEYRLRSSPLFASFIGDKRWNDRLDDYSQEAIDKNLAETRKFLDRFEAIDTAGFPEQEALNKILIVRDLRLELDGAKFKPWEMPVDQQNGIQISLPQMVNTLSFTSVKDYEDYIARLRQMPALVGSEYRADAQRHERSSDAAAVPFGEGCRPKQCDRDRGAGKIAFRRAFLQISREHSGNRSKAVARSRSCRGERFRAARVSALHRVYPR